VEVEGALVEEVQRTELEAEGDEQQEDQLVVAVVEVRGCSEVDWVVEVVAHCVLKAVLQVEVVADRQEVELQYNTIHVDLYTS